MPFDRSAAVTYAKQFWNKISDDDKFGHHSAGIVDIGDTRRRMNAPKPAWNGMFVSNGMGGENGVFRSAADGSTKPDTEFYYVTENGRAYSTRTKPVRRDQKLTIGPAVGYYFENNGEILFAWRLPGGNVRVERWTAPSGAKPASRKIGHFAADLSPAF